MLRLVLGYRSEIRESDPVVLYAGHDADAAQTAIDQLSADYLRVETGELTNARRARRNPDAQPREFSPTLTLDEVKRLSEELEKLRVAHGEEIAGIQAEFKRQIEVGTALLQEADAEIKRLSAELSAAKQNTTTTPAAASSVSDDGGAAAIPDSSVGRSESLETAAPSPADLAGEEAGTGPTLDLDAPPVIEDHEKKPAKRRGQ